MQYLSIFHLLRRLRSAATKKLLLGQSRLRRVVVLIDNASTKNNRHCECCIVAKPYFVIFTHNAIVTIQWLEQFTLYTDNSCCVVGISATSRSSLSGESQPRDLVVKQFILVAWSIGTFQSYQAVGKGADWSTFTRRLRTKSGWVSDCILHLVYIYRLLINVRHSLRFSPQCFSYASTSYMLTEVLNLLPA